MNRTDYDFLCSFLKQKSGLVLNGDKQYLVESRLTPIARKHNIASLEALVGQVRSKPSGPVAEAIIDAMTTNESFFFRDRTPFDLFNNVMLPHMQKERASARRMKIWCAAASTGQEPYSLAMCLKEKSASLAGWNFDILGTDISDTVLAKAKQGIYSQFEVQRGLPVQLLLKYFTQIGETWQINAPIRSMVQYRKLNLLENFSTIGTADIVFCRNVLIYFDQKTKSDILARISKLMAPDGFLVLGAAETVVGLSSSFEPVPGQRGLYRVAQAGAAKSSTTMPLRAVG